MVLLHTLHTKHGDYLNRTSQEVTYVEGHLSSGLPVFRTLDFFFEWEYIKYKFYIRKLMVCLIYDGIVSGLILSEGKISTYSAWNERIGHVVDR